ncbi:MAG: hypothetical protein ACFCGT_15280 [Sandaracinaceae bacterium]
MARPHDRLGVVLLLALAGCAEPVPLPGSSLGGFEVSALLEEDGCGTALEAPTSFAFQVEIVEVEGSLPPAGYWRLPGRDPVLGTVEREGAFRFEERLRQAMPADANGRVCILERRDIVSGELGPTPSTPADLGLADAGVPNDASVAQDGGPAPSPLVGTSTIRLIPEEPALCASWIRADGFFALPCLVTFRLRGEPVPVTW